ncbi:(-)-drimenol synthase-like [Amaranthus tricolor]|uniref:(-)-drimenol synthase-like n=1 Tax=Amaranthus tricolor TaxID=29722 RepID=UPI00258CEA47|nr:(-)-drimenol synthase-like [Amaranthus tricolor]
MDTQCLNATQIARPLANFQPDIWGDRFVNYTPPDHVTQRRMEKEAKELKDLIQKELLKDIKDTKQRIEYLDAIIRLGVAYHFEKEIEDNFQIFQKNIHKSYEDDLHYVSLHFRLLRQHGFHVSCDVFEKFKDENGKFKDSLANDVIYNLYETSYVRVHGESILDEALVFSTKHLTSIVANSSSHPMVEQIARSLELPLHKRSVRVESRHQITFYEAKSSHDERLLKFAKLDFNMLLALHRMELAQYMRWFKNLDKAIKLPNFMRSRVVECYFWSLGAYHESKYAFARLCISKIIRIISILDDIYDAYATTEELIIITKAIQRWDKSCVKQLPEFMKLFYEAMIDTFEEMEQALAEEGRAYAAHYARQQLIATCEGYFEEAKWRFEKHVPTYENYINNGIFSGGYLLIVAASFVGMGDIANENAFKWLHKDSKAPRASCIIARLFDDIAGHKFEQDREHVVSAVECYMKQFGASEEGGLRRDRTSNR